MEIKPTETEYNGFKFRSRLEARWAVFFDNMEIGYEYEFEEYELGNGIRYLPAFYLPKLDMHIEIKPFISEINKYDLKVYDLFALIGGKELLLILGTPGKEEMLLIDRRTIDVLEMIEADFEGEPEQDELVDHYFNEVRSSGSVYFGSLPGNLNFRNVVLLNKGITIGDSVRLEKSLVQAKQSRFDFNN